jgi:hypothetical protein
MTRPVSSVSAAGVVDEHIDGEPIGSDRLDEPARRSWIRQVRGEDVARRGREFRGQGAELRFTAGGENEIVIARENAGDLLADPGARAGDEGDGAR